MFIAGIPSSAGPILIASMTADAADDVRLDSGLDRTALLFGLRNGLSKIGTSVAVGLTLYVVGAAGYDFKHGHNNVAGALTVLACLYAFVPVAMGLTAAWIIRGHKLDAAAHAAIRRALEERDREAGMVGP
ncbi:MAG: MFS transporter [Alphaproteobacteria bacterium]|nr:MFS transporter [Alphaproteobacteria bacterium]